jgi:hypothetical protein
VSKYMKKIITSFYKPYPISIKIDIKERQLDEVCNQKYKHQWLLLPKQSGQKQYIICLNCMETSHL